MNWLKKLNDWLNKTLGPYPPFDYTPPRRPPRCWHSYEYKVIRANSDKELIEKLKKYRNKGWKIVAIYWKYSGEYEAVMEKDRVEVVYD